MQEVATGRILVTVAENPRTVEGDRVSYGCDHQSRNFGPGEGGSLRRSRGRTGPMASAMGLRLRREVSFPLPAGRVGVSRRRPTTAGWS
jgi:hypothetical protein